MKFSMNRFASWPNVFSSGDEDVVEDVADDILGGGPTEKQQLRRSELIKTRSVDNLTKRQCSYCSELLLETQINNNYCAAEQEPPITPFEDNNMLFTNEELAKFGVNLDDFIVDNNNQMNNNNNHNLLNSSTTNKPSRGEIKIDERYGSYENLAQFQIIGTIPEAEENNNCSSTNTAATTSEDQLTLVEGRKNEESVTVTENNLLPPVEFSEFQETSTTTEETVSDICLPEIVENKIEIDAINPPNNIQTNNDLLYCPVLSRRPTNFHNRSLSPEILSSTHIARRVERSSAPPMGAAGHSWSYIDIPHSSSHPERLFSAAVGGIFDVSTTNNNNNNVDNDDVFEDLYNKSPVKKQRVSSADSPLNVANEEDNNLQINIHQSSAEIVPPSDIVTDKEENNLPTELSASPGCVVREPVEVLSHEKSPDDEVFVSEETPQEVHSSTPPTLLRMRSTSASSLCELVPVLEITSSQEHQERGVDLGDEKEYAENENTIVPTRQKSTRSPQTPRVTSLNLPPITPRIPFMGLLPGSVNRPERTTSAIRLRSETNKEKEKEKEVKKMGSGFFGQRNKLKSGKHSWTKYSSPLLGVADLCHMCPQSLINSETYQCADCSVVVHVQCKEQADKTACTKIKLKQQPSPMIKQHSSLNTPTRPPAVGRFSSLREDSPDRKSEDFATVANVSEMRGNLPVGFYCSTRPHSDWDLVDLWHDEPEPWSDTVGKYEKQKLSAKEVKRQNAIHDLYVTEKHHCQTLVVLKHTYFDEMALRCIVPTDELHKMMPNLNDLLTVHLNFLRLLKTRKDESTIVGPVHEDLLIQFTGEIGAKMVTSYTSFCSQKDATVQMYNVLIKENPQFTPLIATINSSGFYKTLSLPDCLMKITQRLSKYHQFVESLRKYSVENAKYAEGMTKAEQAVKQLIKSVDSGIERIQLQQFRIKLYSEMEPKSSTQFGKSSFTATDIISDARQLLYYADVQWPNAKRHSADVLLLLFTDVIVFVQRRSQNGQYNFFTQDDKEGVVPIRKMIARNKAGKLGSDGVYLINTHPKPEMYEVRCKTKKENIALINVVQKAVENYNSSSSTNSNVQEKPPEETVQVQQTLTDEINVTSVDCVIKMTDGNNRQTLEELRKMYVDLEEQKKDFMRMVQEKMFELDQREKAVAEREAKAEREDCELRARWNALYQAWEHQRFNGVPVTPLSPPVSNSTSPSSDLHTVAAPSVYYQPYVPPSVRFPPAQFYPVPPPSSAVYFPPQLPPGHPSPPTTLAYRNGPPPPALVPEHLQGSLVHQPSDETPPPRAVLPSKLSSSTRNGGGDLSSKFRTSNKKMNKSSSSQLLPNRLSNSGGVNNKKK